MTDPLYGFVSRSLSRPAADRILVIAGEESGDVYAGTLISKLRQQISGVVIEGIGGERFRAAGGETFSDITELASVGLGSAMGTLGALRRAFAEVKRRIDDEGYDAVILIDFPDFNLRVAKIADEAGTPVFYYVCPQLWAWRQYRVNTVRKHVDMMIVALPFEEEFYTLRGIDARFYGHPLLDEYPPVTDRDKRRASFGLQHQEHTLLGLLPGSRDGEVRRMLPIMLDAVKIIRSRKAARVVIPCAASIDEKLVKSIVADSGEQANVVTGQTWQAMNACDYMVCKSGTSTLMTTLAGTPMVVVYKADTFSYLMVRLLARIKWAALPNLIADKEVVPELLQWSVTAPKIAETALAALLHPDLLQQQREEMAKISASLGSAGASDRAVEAIIRFLEKLRDDGP